MNFPRFGHIAAGFFARPDAPPARLRIARFAPALTFAAWEGKRAEDDFRAWGQEVGRAIRLQNVRPHSEYCEPSDTHPTPQSMREYLSPFTRRFHTMDEPLPSELQGYAGGAVDAPQDHPFDDML
jgi:hypothetical protein